MKAELDNQVERIIDEGSGRRRSVIVKMASKEDDLSTLSSTASEAIQKRNLAQTARDVLPLSLDKMKLPDSGERTNYMKQQLRSADASVAAQVAASGAQDISTTNLKRVGVSNLKPLLKSEAVQESLEKTRTVDGADVLWISNSVTLELTKDELASLPEEVPEIEGIYPNRTFSVPPVVEAQRLPENVRDNKTSSWGVQAIGALSVWGAYGARGGGVKVGLLDTGVDPTHPDLEGKVTDWAEFDASGAQVPNSQPHDSGEHGTHCAGIIAGGNASGQWIGVAPEVKIAAAMVLKGKRGGTDAQILAGLQWAVESGVDVINMSLGGVWFDPEVRDDYMNTFISCLRLGIPVVVAIGNAGAETTGTPGNDFFAFSVGATDHKDRIAGFSGGRTHIVRNSSIISPDALPLVYSKPDLSAPGVAVMSSTPNANWKAFNGTSMAAPHVTGAIALLLSNTAIRQNIEKHQRAFLVQDMLVGGVEEMGESGQDHRYGFGRIDILRAIGFAKELGY